MPVYNPETKENDYVDLKLVDKILIDSEYIQDMKTNKKEKIDITLKANEEKKLVQVILSNKEVKFEHTHEIELQTFEEMLFHTINNESTQKLENTEDFKAIVYTAISSFIDTNTLNKKHFAYLNEEYVLDNGIGIIHDTKTNQDIGTFESIKYVYSSKKRTVDFNAIILFGRSLEDLAENDRYEFSFYSLDHKLLYSFMINDLSATNFKNNKTSSIDEFIFVSEQFNTDHKFYKLIQEAQGKKALLEGLTEDSPLYEVNMDQFRQSRLSILELSKQKQKQEKIVNQFADIDLGF
ncbi:hypothetical protein M3Y14_34240 (plasmid) [Bacillus thuringiensis]|uniref:hypothetical protein n=1 Tax=Bacillus thuringiensis TaxID=1428 RepID=UPI00222561FF|nr:hypothetical protein [Bacillus thuringiensis]UYX56043.1 hypothetical protein M3Y14_34240 [Bacillus thuringiensis]